VAGRFPRMNVAEDGSFRPPGVPGVQRAMSFGKHYLLEGTLCSGWQSLMLP
jgi:hypothetical protein